MKNFLKVMKYFFITIAVVFAILFVVILSIAINEDNKKIDKNPQILTIEKYGEEYPYTIDNLELKCSPVDAVWVETKEGDKYALNGLAMNKFSKDPSYKGTTNLILKPNKGDVDFLHKGFEFCKK